MIPPQAFGVPHDEVVLDERRSSDRYPCALRSRCQTIEHPRVASAWPAQVLNLSARGIRLVLTRRFEPGTLLSVEICDQGQRLHTLLAVVVRVAPAAYSVALWHHGCALRSELDTEELAILVDRPYLIWIEEQTAPARIAALDEIALADVAEPPLAELVLAGGAACRFATPFAMGSPPLREAVRCAAWPIPGQLPAPLEMSGTAPTLAIFPEPADDLLPQATELQRRKSA